MHRPALWPAALAVRCHRTSAFVRTGADWRYKELLIDVDAESFVPMGDHYGRDVNQVIFADTTREISDLFSTHRLRITRMPLADPTRFVALDERNVSMTLRHLAS